MSTADEIHDTPPGPDGFASAPARRIAFVYIAVTVSAIAILAGLLAFGRELTAPTSEDGGHLVEHGPIDTHEVFWKLLLAVAVVVTVARVVGAGFRRIGQPQVVGEIVAGVLLGPTVLGAVWPGASEYVFSEEVLPFIEILAQFGLVFFMFLVGAELDLRLIRGQGQAAAMVSHASIVFPFVTGVGLAILIFQSLGSPEGDFLPFALFLGASMSITAFPVLARILTERGLHRTRLGTVTITCAAIDDVTAWCILAVVVTVARADGIAGAAPTLALSILFIAAMLLIVRPLLGRLARMHEDQGRLSGPVMATLFVGLVLSALATDRIGIHAIFGAFLFGVILPQRAELTEELFDKLEDFSVILLLPLFFAFSGLRTNVLELGTDPQLWLYTLLVLAVAVAGKWGGSAIAARVVGMGWRDAWSLGALMNCRGLTELVILNIGLELGVIPPTLFSILVIMALVTTFMTSPLLQWLRPDIDDEVERASEADDGESVQRVLVHVASMDHAYELLHTALAAVESSDERTDILLVRTLHVGDDRLLSGAIMDGGPVERARRSLAPLEQFVTGSGARVSSLVVQTSDVSRTLVALAHARTIDLVVLRSGRAFSPAALRSGTLGRVLERVESDVLVVVDPGGSGSSPPPNGSIVVPFDPAEDRALRLAVRIARTHGAKVRLVTPPQYQDEATEAAALHPDSIVSTSVGSAAAVSNSLQAGADADLVIVPLGTGLETPQMGEQRWSTTPVLAIRQRPGTPSSDQSTREGARAEALS